MLKKKSIENYESQINVKLSEFKHQAQARVTSAKKNFIQSCNSLHSSNSLLLKSARPFSKGGNYSSQELDNLNEKIRQLDVDIVEIERRTVNSIQDMETSQIFQASNICSDAKSK